MFFLTLLKSSKIPDVSTVLFEWIMDSSVTDVLGTELNVTKNKNYIIIYFK